MEEPDASSCRSGDLVVDYGHGKSSVEINPSHTLAAVRCLLLEEFDDDMFPDPDDQKWAFWVHGLRITRKQEARKVAWNYLDHGVCIQSTATRTDPAELPAFKRAKLEDSTSSLTSISGGGNGQNGATTAMGEEKETCNNNDSDTPNDAASPYQNDNTKNSQKDSGKAKTDDALMEEEEEEDSDSTTAISTTESSNDASPTKKNENNDDKNKKISAVAKKDDALPMEKDSDPTRTSRTKASSNDGESDLMAPVVSYSDHDNDLNSEEAKKKSPPEPQSNASMMDVEDLLSDDDDDTEKKQPANNSKDDDQSVEEALVLEEQQPNANPHAEADMAMEKARNVLQGIEKILDDTKDHELFCTKQRRTEWTEELTTLLKSERPKTIIGVLGNTGVGKSSLLNGLLDEAAVLPTSGSRGCTAAVVELVYNHALLEEPTVVEEPAAVLPGSVLPPNVTLKLQKRIQTLVGMWAEEEQLMGRNVYYWHIMKKEGIDMVASQLPATLEELKALDVFICEQKFKDYGERLLKNVEAFLQMEHPHLLETKQKAKEPAHGELNQRQPPQKEVSVYRGEIEFMNKGDWIKELEILLDECSTQEKFIYKQPPDSNVQPDAAAAWSKIEQVYGGSTMYNQRGKPTAQVLNKLANDSRVNQLLTPTTPGALYNVIPVEEGKVAPGSDRAKAFVKPYAQTSMRDRRTLKKFATAFRQKINDYVYRKGNGNQPQTWPLIRKVTLYGPWAVLSTGACLVDLPGVRDANAARAKVAESYLQHCSNIWIVAPIKRAVDDGTAKELLGEQFKRRLLMDGQYGNVSFICTQTDDIEATETMRDHEDVARQVPGRWEEMEKLATELKLLEAEKNDKLQEEEELKANIDDSLQVVKVAKAELKEFLQDAEVLVDVDVDGEECERLKTALLTAKASKANNESKLKEWQALNAEAMALSQRKCGKLQRRLKAYCAQVRNSYSKGCLQEDFKNGLKELTNNADTAAIPEDFAMPVFAISANDYMKIMQIKPQSDGPPNTFTSPADTQIPMLRSFVHDTTSTASIQFAKSVVDAVGDLIDRVKLVATDSKDAPSGKTAFRLQQSFLKEINYIETAIGVIATSFENQLATRIQQNLFPSLSVGAQRGSQAASSTVSSWGSSIRRSRKGSEKRPGENGLHFSTYFAVVRRDGEYTSPTFGEVNMNQELYDPMEKSFATDWQRIMDASTRSLLESSRVRVQNICEKLKGQLANALAEAGLEKARLNSIVTAGSRGCATALTAAFQQMQATSTNLQRELTRSMLPKIKDKMKECYEATKNVPGGTGKFNRMKGAMDSTTRRVFASMFSETLSQMQQAISAMVKEIAKALAETSSVINRSYESVLSICWDSAQAGKAGTKIDPALQQKMRECRDGFLSEIHRLLAIQKESCHLMGIEREEEEVDVMQVESFDVKLKKAEQEAKKKGNAFDLCDSDAEDAAPVVPLKRIKAEPGAEPPAAAARPPAAAQGNDDVIDLCDSDNESSTMPPATSTQMTTQFKSDPNERAAATRTGLHDSVAAISSTIRAGLAALDLKTALLESFSMSENEIPVETILAREIGDRAAVMAAIEALKKEGRVVVADGTVYRVE